MPLKLTKFRAAAVSAAPVYLNLEATLEKACKLIGKSAAEGAQLIAFPETFLPGYPHWLHVLRVDQGNHLHVQLVKNAVEISGPATDELCQAAKRAGAIVVIGINERDPATWGTLYNTNIIINQDGEIIGTHRKIMPTLVEKICWGFGDGTSLQVYDTEIGRIGTLICGENTNPLAKFALMAQGEQVHIANYPANPTKTRYNLTEATEIRARAMCFEGKVFTLTSSSVFTKEMRDMICKTEDHRDFMSCTPSSYTAIHGPDGRCLSGPVMDREEIVYADINLEDALIPKIRHDVAGHYNRFDIMWLGLNRSRQRSIHEGPRLKIGHDNKTSKEDFYQKLVRLLSDIDDDLIRQQIQSLVTAYWEETEELG